MQEQNGKAHMTTLNEARQRVRLALEDTGASSGWSDDEIDAGLSRALDEYSHRYPQEHKAAIPVTSGDSSLNLPEDARKVIRVFDPRGNVIPPQTIPLRGTAGSEQSWEVWGNRVEFTRRLPEGEVTLWYLGPREFPDSDESPVPVPEEDLSLLALGSVMWCLEQRAVADWKRGALPARYETVLRRAQESYRAAWRSRERRVRAGRVVGTG
jgi:hypothetical protein